MELSELYSNRFAEADRMRKVRIWTALWKRVFSRWVRPEDTVLDLGAGYCEFINACVARRRIAVDLNPDTLRLAAPGVEVHKESASELTFLRDGEVDVVFTSNFLEHLPNKDVLTLAMKTAWRVLRPGGTFIAMGPNIRFLASVYWDYYDHHIPLSDRSVCELLIMCGFEIRRIEPRFLPYTVKSRLPQWDWLVRAYLALRPASSFVLGKQFLVIASKPEASTGEPLDTAGRSE
jgi:SAM-dependent methyltransferase